MPVVPFQGKHPVIGKNVFIAPTAYVIGDVTIGDDVTIMFGAVLRGDINPIQVGRRTNIQENAVLHTSRGIGPCVLEEEVSVGHCAVLHGCTAKKGSLIGMNATVLDSAVIGEGAIVAAQALVLVKYHVPPNMVAVGVPASIAKEVSERDRTFTTGAVDHYVKTGREYSSLLLSKQIS